VTEVNGLRLAYRGFVGGIAGGYVWAAIAMALAGLLHADPLRPLRPLALAISPLAGASELAFVLGLAVVQLGGALIGMVFAYFFARFFTVRSTLRLAAPAAAILGWAFVAVGADRLPGAGQLSTDLVPLVATIGYGILLGGSLPVRGEVLRYAGSPST